MEQDKIIKALEQYAESLLEPLPGYFLVAVKLAPSNQVTVFIDADLGASIDQLASVNRSLYKRIEGDGLFGEGGNFSLEVSSPGLDEPLKLYRQYRKNIGRQVEVLLTNGIRHTGLLKDAGEEKILLEVVQGKKKEKQIQVIDIPFNQIKFTKVRVVF